MSDFTKILTHTRRLQAAVKDLSVAELEQVAGKLQAVIEARKAEEAEKAEKLEQKAALRASLLKQMQEAWMNWLVTVPPLHQKTKRSARLSTEC